MDRHELDPVALIAGLVFVGLGVGFLADRWTWFGLDAQWGMALLLVGLGIAAVAGTVRRARRERADD